MKQQALVDEIKSILANLKAEVGAEICALYDKKGLLFGIGYRAEAAILSKVTQIVISANNIFESSRVGCLESALVATEQAGIIISRVFNSPTTYLCLILPSSDVLGLASLGVNAARVEITSLLSRLLDKKSEGEHLL